ncbi:Protein ABHD17C [Fasciola gigantica]|uniref:Protein ABHD17C n=1 Tax=Fasciola gigantica TaxID=46835 RepID=A0A504YGK2_FASGI|nr:Protein ABHD17C [Fasciola gigantica]
MNDLTCNSICQLLCCPPVPSKIAAKLAFMPPPASYQLSPSTENDGQYSFAFASFLKDSFLHFVPDNIEVTKAKTRKGNTIAILYMRTNPNTKLTFLLSHGNAVDLGLMVNFMHELGTKLSVNMMCYDYSGYGASSGKPLEKNLYADAETALDVLKTKFSVPMDQIVLYGQSIGTVPTVHLATLHRVAAVVLHSPLMSGLRVAFPRLKRNYCCDVFSNLARAPRILSPTLVIHGTRDEVVHINHGYRICSALAENVLLDPLFIDGAGHNDCEMFPQYLLRLSKLVTVEIPRLRGRSDLERVDKIPNTGKCDFHINPPEANSVLGDDTDPSSSSSHRLSQEFRDNSPTVSRRSTHSDRSSRRCISPVVVENLRSVLLKRRLLTKHSTASLTGNMVNTGKTEDFLINSENVSHPSPFSSSETNVSLLRNKELTISKPVHFTDLKIAQVPATVTEPESADNAEICVVFDIKLQPNDVKRDSEDQPNMLSVTPTSSPDDLTQLLLPPPPPPPPVSLLGDCPESQEVLWSLHAARGRKNLTLPQNFNPHRLLNSDWAKLKTETLPREFRQFSPDNEKPSTETVISFGSPNELHAQASLSTSTISTSSESSTSVLESTTAIVVVSSVDEEVPMIRSDTVVEQLATTDHVKQIDES